MDVLHQQPQRMREATALDALAVERPHAHLRAAAARRRRPRGPTSRCRRPCRRGAGAAARGRARLGRRLGRRLVHERARPDWPHRVLEPHAQVARRRRHELRGIPERRRHLLVVGTDAVRARRRHRVEPGLEREDGRGALQQHAPPPPFAQLHLRQARHHRAQTVGRRRPQRRLPLPPLERRDLGGAAPQRLRLPLHLGARPLEGLPRRSQSAAQLALCLGRRRALAAPLQRARAPLEARREPRTHVLARAVRRHQLRIQPPRLGRERLEPLDAACRVRGRRRRGHRRGGRVGRAVGGWAGAGGRARAGGSGGSGGRRSGWAASSSGGGRGGGAAAAGQL